MESMNPSSCDPREDQHSVLWCCTDPVHAPDPAKLGGGAGAEPPDIRGLKAWSREDLDQWSLLCRQAVLAWLDCLQHRDQAADWERRSCLPPAAGECPVDRAEWLDTCASMRLLEKGRQGGAETRLGGFLLRAGEILERYRGRSQPVTHRAGCPALTGRCDCSSC